MALTHGPKASHAEMWPQWTSQTDVGRWPPEWYCMSSCGPLIPMEPSDIVPMIFFKSGPHGPPAASDGPPTACNM